MSEEDQQIVDRVVANYGKALEAYTRKLVSKDGPFNRYVAGEAGAISASAKRGLKLFVGKAACSSATRAPTSATTSSTTTAFLHRIAPACPTEPSMTRVGSTASFA